VIVFSPPSRAFNSSVASSRFRDINSQNLLPRLGFSSPVTNVIWHQGSMLQLNLFLFFYRSLPVNVSLCHGSSTVDGTPPPFSRSCPSLFGAFPFLRTHYPPDDLSLLPIRDPVDPSLVKKQRNGPSFRFLVFPPSFLALGCPPPYGNGWAAAYRASPLSRVSIGEFPAEQTPPQSILFSLP